jgi:hypothetical protein
MSATPAAHPFPQSRSPPAQSKPTGRTSAALTPSATSRAHARSSTAATTYLAPRTSWSTSPAPRNLMARSNAGLWFISCTLTIR